MKHSSLPIFLNGVMLFLLAAAAHYLLITLDRSRIVEKRALELQVLAREAELKAFALRSIRTSCSTA